MIDRLTHRLPRTWEVDREAFVAAAESLGVHPPTVRVRDRSKRRGTEAQFLMGQWTIDLYPHAIRSSRLAQMLAWRPWREHWTSRVWKAGGISGVLWHELTHAYQQAEGRLPDGATVRAGMEQATQSEHARERRAAYLNLPWESEAFAMQVRGTSEPLVRRRPLRAILRDLIGRRVEAAALIDPTVAEWQAATRPWRADSAPAGGRIPGFTRAADTPSENPRPLGHRPGVYRPPER